MTVTSNSVGISLCFEKISWAVRKNHLNSLPGGRYLMPFTKRGGFLFSSRHGRSIENEKLTFSAGTFPMFETTK